MKWTSQEDQLLKENYKKLGLKNCQKLLPHRTKISIQSRAIRHLDLNPRLDKTSLINIWEAPTFKFAYTLGLLWADGYFDYRTIRIECVEEDILYFKTQIFSPECWSFHRRERPNRKPQATMVISDTLFARQMYKLGFISNRTSFSSALNTLPESLHPAFYLGLFDGDGCCYVKPKGHPLYQMSITGRLDVDWSPLTKVLQNKNIKFSILHNKIHHFSQVRVCGKVSFKLFGEYLYDGHTEGLPRKRTKFMSAKE